jgi:hypothetical protein
MEERQNSKGKLKLKRENKCKREKITPKKFP